MAEIYQKELNLRNYEKGFLFLYVGEPSLPWYEYCYEREVLEKSL